MNDMMAEAVRRRSRGEVGPDGERVLCYLRS